MDTHKSNNPSVFLARRFHDNQLRTIRSDHLSYCDCNSVFISRFNKENLLCESLQAQLTKQTPVLTSHSFACPLH